MRIKKDSSTRKLITYVMGRLEAGDRVVLQGLGICVHKAITVALISRDRLGNVYQQNSLLVLEDPAAAVSEADKATAEEGEAAASSGAAKPRTSTGIQIILSKSPLDSS